MLKFLSIIGNPSQEMHDLKWSHVDNQAKQAKHQELFRYEAISYLSYAFAWLSLPTNQSCEAASLLMEALYLIKRGTSQLRIEYD